MYENGSGGDRKLLALQKQIFAIGIVAYSSATGAFYPAPYGADSSEAYIIGTPSAQVKGLKCRFWYIK